VGSVLVFWLIHAMPGWACAQTNGSGFGFGAGIGAGDAGACL